MTSVNDHGFISWNRPTPDPHCFGLTPANGGPFESSQSRGRASTRGREI